jgi:hypothetical protein
VQLEYDGLTPEARALADELREFVLMKDAKIRERKRREEERPWDALCYQYERQMLAEMGEGAAFGELVAFESAEEARSAFESFLQKQAAKKRGKFPIKAQELIDNQTIDKAQELIDNQTIDKIMEAYDRTHGEFDHEGTRVLWSTVDARVAVEFDSGMGQRGGGAKA